MAPLSSESAAALLASESDVLPPLWIISGDELLLALETADAIRSAAKRLGYEEREVLSLSAASDWSELDSAVGGLSLFSAKKLVEARLASQAPGPKGIKALARLASADLEGVCVVVTIPGVHWKVKKLKWFTELAGKAMLVTCDPLPLNQFPAWLGKRLAREGRRFGKSLAMDRDALALLAEMTEGNLLAAAQEVGKLALLHESQGPVTRAEVEATVMRNSRFDWDSVGQAAMLGDAARACRAIDGIRAENGANSAMPILVFRLTSDIRNMLAVRTRMGTGESAERAAEALRIYPREKQAAVAAGARRNSLKRLANALSVCADIDKIYKGVPVPSRDSDPWIELKSMAVFLAR